MNAADSLYNRLVLLVGKSGSGKTAVLQDIADDLDVPIINVNLQLSSQLLELTHTQRRLKLQKLLSQITDQSQSPLILDNLEILFDTDLKQDPLRLLRSISRNHTVLATWNGSLVDQKLMYAEIGHSEFRTFSATDLQIITMNNSESSREVDSV